MATATATKIHPFRVDVPQADLDDLNERLARTRLPQPTPNDDWQYGADDFKTIRTFAERDNSNIVHWSEFPDGGHFAAMERPDVLVDDLRTFFRPAVR